MFQGFGPEAIDFLWGIRMNNQRDWFLAHKSQYQEALYMPMKELGQELFRPFREVPGMELKVSRIYRDARLHHPDPYKESLWICIRRQVEVWSEHPALFFELCPEGGSFGFLLWGPRPAAMEAFRQALTAEPGAFSALARQAEAGTGLPLTAESYKREKPCPAPAAAPYYNWKCRIGAVAELPPGPELFDPALADRVRDTLWAYLPVNEYFQKCTG